jgi:epoxyqueuosine reductase
VEQVRRPGGAQPRVPAARGTGRARLAELLALDDAGFRRLFSGSPIKRIGRDRFVRNCLIAAGNSGNARLEAPVRALLADPDPVVAEAADWALARLTAAP